MIEWNSKKSPLGKANMLLAKNFKKPILPIIQRKGTAFMALFLIFILTGCNDDNEKDEVESNFDRQELLVNLADHYIVPGYSNLNTSMEELDNNVQEFTTEPGANTLMAAREAWKSTLKKWQYVAPFNFGPAMEDNLLNTANLYPVDTVQIEGNITSGSYDLGSAINTQAIGFEAMDYLLYGSAESDQAIIERFGNSPANGDYLKAVSSQLKEKISAVAQAWNGEYRNTFVNSTATNVGSSFGLLINSYTNYYEKHLRDGKIGIPSGARSSQGTPFPKRVEAYYSRNNSLDMLEAGLTAYDHIFNGTGQDGQNRKGLADYLDYLEAQFEGQPLSAAIKEQMNSVEEHVQQLHSPLSQAMNDQQQTALDTFEEMQKLVVLYKVDMSSAMSILITYTDNDGD